MEQENRTLYLDLLVGNWNYINDTTISTDHQIACDLNHPNINRIFKKAMIDMEKVRNIVNTAFQELNI